ncbi:MAG: hypothetical protein EPN65_16635 [Pandoraea sp.]|uniref:hypothetical protein n=1 Tax=Pandoraea sp. TaxID=1883445 RepID=UPI00121A63CF|nr:hypothetical protein [Pandoraea sp.]TAM15940.1 MAG: hypothetical protein EPN65_16635 [Pandoraea sp.]
MEFFRKLFGKKSRSVPKPTSSLAGPNSMRPAIKASPEKLAEEANVKSDVYAALPDALRGVGVFRLDTIESLIAELRRRETDFQPVSAYHLKKDAIFPLADGTMTTLHACLIPEAGKNVNAVKLINRIAGDLTNRIQQKYDLQRWAAMGVKSVKIYPGKPHACPRVQRIRKIHPIEEAPPIPLIDCTEKFCSCGYRPLFEGIDYERTIGQSDSH